MKLLVSLKQFISRLIFTGITYTLPPYQAEPHTTKLCVLLCHRDVPMFSYMMHSLAYFSKMRLPVIVINDGSLVLSDIRFLQNRYQATIVEKQHILHTLSQSVFKQYPYIQRFITASYTPIIKWKIAFMLTNPSKRYLFIDSDILFFSKPDALIRWMRGGESICRNLEYQSRIRTFKYSDDENYLDVYHAYRTALQTFLYPEANTLFNNGILCVPNCSLIDPKKLNEILRVVHETYFDNQFGTDELILSCLLSAKHTTRSLSSKQYLIQLDSVRNKNQHPVCRHYCWRAKLLFPRDALTVWFRTGGFKNTV